MEYLDIIKKLNKIDLLEKENNLNSKDFKKRKDNLNVQQTSVDTAYRQYKEVSETMERKLKHSKIVYWLGVAAVMFLVIYVILLFPKVKIFNPAIDAKIEIISLVGFIGFIIAYIIVDYCLRSYIYEWERSRKSFIDLQNIFISDYLETLVYGYKLDLKMYKDIYKNVYDVQEYLRENDKKGFNSFNKAFETLKIDLSKYTNKTEEPHIRLVDISELNG